MIYVLIFSILLVLFTHPVQAEFRTITDMRGKEVKIPANPKRVITLDDGFTAGIMTSLGVQEKIIALGSHCPTKIFKYDYPVVDGSQYSYTNGMNPVGYLNPWLREVPYMATYGQSINFEELAKLEPDLVFMRVGSCYTSDDSEVLARMMKMIEAMNIPLIVLKSSTTVCDPTAKNISAEILVVGEAFGRKEQAEQLATYLESIVDMIDERTTDVTEEQKPNVLLFGLSPKARGEGGAGTAHGKETIESFFLEKTVKAVNAFDGSGSFSVINAEHLFAMDPDVIILPTAWGYHPPKELYTAPYYKKLSGLSAVKNHRIVALPWTPCNCAKRIEYPIELMVMAKACHPKLFEDIAVNSWVLDFYTKVYGVDRQTAQGLRSAQWLDWTVEEQW
jgi:iron complex transport system substrate-binding protein